MQSSIPKKITTAIDGLLYLSESEAPVTLLQWPDVDALKAAQQKIADLTQTNLEAQLLQTPGAFLQPILRMAVPEDQAMQAYAKRWKSVFKKLQTGLQDVQVITTPVKDAQQEIYIIGINGAGALVLHTSAIAT